MKKRLITISCVVFLGIVGLANAYGGNLYEHYKSKIPALKERAKLYSDIDSDKYKGTAEQNTKLHEYLDLSQFVSSQKLGSLAVPPSTVEGTSTAGWSDDGSIVRLNTSSDSVGIGTSNPPQKLSIIGGNFHLQGDVSWISGNMSLNGGTINFGSSTGTTTLTSQNGRLGIGTSTPTGALSVQGNAFLTGTTTSGVLEATSTVVTSLLRATGTTTLNSIPIQWPSTQCSSGQVYQNDGGGVLSCATPAAAKSTLLLATTTSSVVSDAGATEQTAFSYSLAGNSLSTGNVVRVRALITSWNLDHTPQGASQNTTIRFKYGATAMVTETFTSVASASVTSLRGYIEFLIIGNGATNAQSALTTINAAQNITTPITNSYLINVSDTGSSAIDSTAAQTISITGQVSADDSDNNGFTVNQVIVELLK